MSSRTVLVLTVAATVVSSLPMMTPANASQRDSVDLLADADVEIKNSARLEVAAAGDVNGDGRADVLIGDVDVGAENFHDNWRTYVVFGQTQRTQLDVENLGDNGFRINPATSDDYAHRGAGIGDVNGDGLDDIIIGAQGADNNQRGDSGTAYVVFGKTSSETVELLLWDLGLQLDRGYRIDGAEVGDFIGSEVAGLGDVNADGVHDVIVWGYFAGSSYVVFGQRSPQPIDLLTFDLGLQDGKGYRIDSPVPSQIDGYSVAGPGDVNGDGTPDVAIGFINRGRSPGVVYVVFGKSTPEPLLLRDLGPAGYAIRGICTADQTGYSVSGAGDVNQDGHADLVIGSPQAGCSSSRSAGRAYVVFGKVSTTKIKLRELGRHGYRIEGAQPLSDLGTSVAGVGDINGDQIPDVVLGAPNASTPGRAYSGSAYVIYGKKKSGSIRVADLGHRGYRVKGEIKGQYVAFSVAGPGDTNGDDVPDMLLGAGAEDGSLTGGMAYIVWGRV